MYVIDQTPETLSPIPGVAHATWAGEAEGLTQLSVWRQRIAPGGATPPHRHPCDEVVLCTAGTAELHIDGQRLRFGAGQTAILPKNVLHQIVNTGDEPLELTASFGATPVEVYLPDGEKLELPWRT